MLKKIFAAATLALLLTACSASTVENAAPSIPPAGEADSESAEIQNEAKVSDRGNVIKEVGEGSVLLASDGSEMARFSIDSITVDGKCTGQHALKPENGHFLILDMQVSTKPSLSQAINREFLLGPNDSWKLIAPNGTTSNAHVRTGAAVNCFEPAAMIPEYLGPSEKAQGKFVLDVENASGTLVYRDMNTGASWEWEYALNRGTDV